MKEINRDRRVPNTDKATFSVAELQIILGIGRNSVYEAIRCGQIPSIRIGTRILVPRTALEALLSGNPPQEVR
jgi:excisionase family DNA binding protein